LLFPLSHSIVINQLEAVLMPIQVFLLPLGLFRATHLAFAPQLLMQVAHVAGAPLPHSSLPRRDAIDQSCVRKVKYLFSPIVPLAFYIRSLCPIGPEAVRFDLQAPQLNREYAL